MLLLTKDIGISVASFSEIWHIFGHSIFTNGVLHVFRAVQTEKKASDTQVILIIAYIFIKMRHLNYVGNVRLWHDKKSAQCAYFVSLNAYFLTIF